MKVQQKSYFKFRVIRKGHTLLETAIRPNVGIFEGHLNMLDVTMSDAINYNAAWLLGLVTDPPTIDSETDTFARITSSTPNPPTTNDWQELTQYAEGVRQDVIWGAIDSQLGNPDLSPFLHEVDNFDSPCVFHINASVILGGAFLLSEDLGKLYAVVRESPGIVLNSGDVLIVFVASGFINPPV